MIRAHFTDNETGWVEPEGDGTAIVLCVPWTTSRFSYLDRVALVPSTGCSCKNCKIPQVGEFLWHNAPHLLHSWVVTLRRQKQKNLRRLMEMIAKVDPESRCAHLQESWEVRVATRLDRNELAWQLMRLPFRVNVLDFYPGKVG